MKYTYNLGTYDTIHLALDYSLQGVKQSDLFLQLENLIPHGWNRDYYTGTYSHICTDIGGYWELDRNKKDKIKWNISINNDKIYIKGSLPKNMFGTNIISPTRKQMQSYVCSMSNDLGLDLSKAKVNRMDSSANLPMSVSPTSYYHYIGSEDHYTRIEYPSSLLYTHKKQKAKTLYDKIQWAEDEGYYIPPHLQSHHILRVENRQLNNGTLGRILKLKQPNLWNVLYQDEHYETLVNTLIDEMNNIPIQNNIHTSAENVKTYGDMMGFALAIATEQIGEEIMIKGVQETVKGQSLKLKDAKKRSKQFYLFRKNLINKIKPYRVNIDLVDEWKNKIKNIELI
jgi:hypothetical protein